MLTFPSAPPPQTRHPPQGLGELLKSTFFFGGKNSTHWLFLNPLNPQRFRAWRHSHLLVIFPIWDFYFYISEWHILSARAWTPALLLHLTNPCAKRNVLSLTKQKGKIYKTKSQSLHQERTLLFTIEGARGVMVIVVGNGHGDTSSNPGRYWLHFT